MFHTTPTERRSTRRGSSVSREERQRIKDEAVRLIRQRQAEAVQRRRAAVA